jgi:chemotaxis protein CheX
MNPALSERHVNRIQPDASWQILIQNSAIEVFHLMVGAEVKPPAHIPEARNANVSALVGMAGAVAAVFTFSCSTESAHSIANYMLGGQNIEEGSAMYDAMGEICNMVAGNFKAKISGMADGCMLSVPTVVTGDNFDVHSVPNGQRLEACLEFEGRPVWITLEFSG